MGRALLAICFLALSQSLSGQVPHFAQGNSRWSVAHTYPDASPQNPYFIATTTRIYGFVGDTLVQGERWRKMYSSKDSLFAAPRRFEGYCRSSAELVLWAQSNFQVDTLYQFNLSLGDSVYFPLPQNGQKLAVQRIDSLLIQGQYYRRWHFSEARGPNAFTYVNEVWLEGIGSIHGPLFPKQARPFSTEKADSLQLTCTESIHGPIWQHPHYPGCYLNVQLGQGEKLRPNWEVFPNPFQDKLQLRGLAKEAVELRIFSASGQEMGRWSSHGEENMQLRLDFLAPGMYYLSLHSSQEQWSLPLFKKP